MSNVHQNRWPSFSSSTKSSIAKRLASLENNSSKPSSNMAVTTKKRASLGNITNQNNGSRIPNPSSDLVSTFTISSSLFRLKELFLKSNQIFDVFASANCSNKSAKLKLAQPTQPSSVKPSISKVTSLPYEQTKLHSPSKSDAASVSIDKTMSSCDSYKSPQVEYIDNEQVSAVVSIERKALSNLYITPSSETTFNCCRRDVLSDMENKDKVVNIDNNDADPHLIAMFVVISTSIFVPQRQRSGLLLTSWRELRKMLTQLCEES